MNSKMIPICRNCFACKKDTAIKINKETYDAYQHYANRDGIVNYIQDVPVESEETDKGKQIVREFLKTGMCRKCQRIIFG